MTSELWPWLATLGVLGVYHGINPAMGWLFAVALGLQERRRSAVLRALPLIALGHEASVAVVVVLVSGLQLVADPELIRVVGAVGADRLWRLQIPEAPVAPALGRAARLGPRADAVVVL